VKRLIIALLICTTLLIISSCEDEALNIDTESSIPVRVESVVHKNIEEYVFSTGTVHAVQASVLKAMQSGYYRLQTNPRTGQPYAMSDEVKQGDVIIKLINPEFENQITFESAKLTYESSQGEFEIQKKMFEKGGITPKELTEAERAFIDARYNYDNAKIQLEKLKITALFDGTITDLPFFGQNQLVETGTLLAEVMDYSKLYSEVSLPGKEMERLRKEQPVKVTNYNKADDTLYGIVTQVSPTLDPNSRMFKATLEIENDSFVLRPGMFVKADIVVDSRDSAIVIPKEIVLDRRGNRIVYVIDKGIAVERKLETGLSNKVEIEVLSGLSGDDRLVIEGFETLRNRSKVKVLD